MVRSSSLRMYQDSMDKEQICVVKCLFAKYAFDHGMMKKGYIQLHQI
jgi:hypothetical protein